MAKSKTQANIYAKQYVQEVFEARLREEGFTCPDDKLLCWYRLKNKQIIQTVIFCTPWADLPLFLEFGYETSPLFTRPVYTNSVVYLTSTHHRTDCFRRIGIREAGAINSANLGPYIPDIQVAVPMHAGRGLYTFTDVILPEFERVNTVYECYAAHKQYHLDNDTAFGGKLFETMSREFIDEVIYVDDQEVYPYCKDRILQALKMYQYLSCIKPNSKEVQEALPHWEQLKVALLDNGRQEYLEILERRKVENMVYLKKRLGISI